MAPLVALALAVLLLVPTAAQADRVVAEVSDSSSIAIDGSLLAWQETVAEGDNAVVLDDGRTRRRFNAGGFGGQVTLGDDERGRLTLVFTRCERESRCTLRRVDPRTGRARTVRGIVGSFVDVELRRGRLAWIARNAVRTRALAGGPTRRQGVGRGKIELSGLDHDGRRLVVVGEVEPEIGSAAFALRLVRFGSSRARSLTRVNSGEEYRTIREPILERDGVVLTRSNSDLGAGELLRVPVDSRKRSVRVALGADFNALARGGGRTAYVQAPGDGCASGASGVPGDDIPGAPASCRIVRASADPFGTRARATPPVLELDEEATPAADGSAEVSGRLLTFSVRRGRVVGRDGVAGAAVEVQVGRPPPNFDPEENRDPGLSFSEAGAPRTATTDGDGRFALILEPDAKDRIIRAVTAATPRAFSRDVLFISG